jgi:hypothetical protein
LESADDGIGVEAVEFDEIMMLVRVAIKKGRNKGLGL